MVRSENLLLLFFRGWVREKGEEKGESGKEKSDDGGKRGWKESDKNRLQHTLNDPQWAKMSPNSDGQTYRLGIILI